MQRKTENWLTAQADLPYDNTSLLSKWVIFWPSKRCSSWHHVTACTQSPLQAWTKFQNCEKTKKIIFALNYYILEIVYYAAINGTNWALWKLNNNEHSWNLYCCLKIPFVTKRNQSFLEKWLVPGPDNEVYMMCVEYLDRPESKESSKTNRVMSKK